MCHPMSKDDARRLLNLVNRWGGACIICGRPFKNLACVTRDHVIAKSRGGPKSSRYDHPNIAPAHWRCNQVKANGSLLAAAQEVDRMEKRLGRDFLAWLNRAVPKRKVPQLALMSLVDAAWFFL